MVFASFAHLFARSVRTLYHRVVKLTAYLGAYFGDVFGAQGSLLGRLGFGKPRLARFFRQLVYSVYLFFFHIGLRGIRGSNII